MTAGVRRALLTWALLLAAAWLTACGRTWIRTGWDFPTAPVSTIADGHTTKKQVEDWFGTPFSITQRSGGEVWTYSVTRMSSRGVFLPFLNLNFGGNTQKTELVLTFNDQGIVVEHVYTSQGYREEDEKNRSSPRN